MSLTDEQHVFIKQYGMGEVVQGKWKIIAEAMKASPMCSLTPAQENNIDGLADRIKNFVQWKRRSGDSFFTNQWGKQTMSGDQCKALLDALCTPPSERGETPPPPLNDIPYTHSNGFKAAWEKMVVVDHDYNGNGNKFTYISLEYDDANVRAEKAASMYLDNGCQIEMDFFVGVSPKDSWQVGHIGFSDLNHRYWILGVVIAHSENNVAAGILLKHALSLLKGAGGKGNRVLVDGGTGLAKAINNENEVRQLLEDFKLIIRRCLAHCLRKPFSRGGGYHGGKGSVFQALYKNNVPRKIVGKIVGLLIMMTFIPPDKEECYGVAIDLLIKEYDEYLSQNFRAQYLTKDPNDLGGLCAGRPGEVASTNGMERRGGCTKGCHRDHCKELGLPSTKSGNPLLIISALGIDGQRKQNNIENVSAKPNYTKVESAYAQLRTWSKYTIPRPDELLCNMRKNRNFCSDITYCLCVATVTDDTGSNVEKEVPLHAALGNKGLVYKVTFPTMSAQNTELKNMKNDEVMDTIGGPAALQEHSSMEDVKVMLGSPLKCARVFTELDDTSQQCLKRRIHSRLRNNTSQPRVGETCEDYIRRHANRDHSALASKRFAKKFQDRTDKKSNSKKSKQQEKLERDKWGKEEKEDEQDHDDLAHFYEKSEIFDVDAELEDTAKNVEIAFDNNEGIEGNIDMTFTFDQKEIDLLNSDAAEKSEERVRMLRELGEGVTVCIGNDCETTCCNCEMFNRWRICRHVVWIEVLHFGKFPTGDISDAEDSWESIRERILDTIQKTHVDISNV